MNRFAACGSIVALVLGMAACGGGGGGGGGTSAPPASGSITGTAVKGPVSGATVTAYGISNGAMGAKIASATTDAQGAFRLAMGQYAGPVMLQMSGGSYTDESTGSTMSMSPGDVMSAVMPSMTAGASVTGIQMTPLTSMAQSMAQRMAGGMTDANISTANTAVGNYCMVGDILHTSPMNPLATGSGNAATQDAINYGMTLAAMSQLAHSYGMSSSSAMVTAMMNDASDGIMDGHMAGSTVMMGSMSSGMGMPASAGTTGLAAAMSAFVVSPQNHSGVAMATLQQLMNQLNSSDGHMLGSGITMGGGSMSGTAFIGTMSQAMVTAYAVNGGMRGAQIGSTATDAHGGFTMALGSYSGPVMMQVSGGSYMDEATGQPMTMGADVMTAVMPAMANGATVNGVWVTPMSSMAQARAQAMTGGMTSGNVSSANTAVGNYFMMSDVLHPHCMDPAVPGSGSGASDDDRNCGMVVAAMSQYAKQLGMTSSMGFVTSMMDDASDGMMDGHMGSSQIQMGGGMMGGGMGGGNMMQSNAGTSGLAGAMTDFIGSMMNHSGVTAADMNALIQKLAASNGAL